MKTLTRPELEQIRDALLSGYPSWGDLDQLAAFALDIDLEVEVGKGGGLRTVAFELLKFTQAHGWTEALLRQAVARRPGNPMLADQRRLWCLAPEPFAGRNAGYQARVLQHSGLVSVGRWSQRQVESERPVCQILRGKEAVGTGFLVGPDLVMTNWHVFQAAPGSGNLGASQDYHACFDYRGDGANAVADEGVSVGFAANAVRDASHREELDYVIVGLRERVGEAPMPDGRQRSWLRLGTREFEAHEATVVLQHPAGRTMEVSMGAVTGWHREGAVFEHTAETENGSSGSPCFGADWTLLGLHHRVDPQTGQRNRGIATSAILQRMGAINPPTIGLLPAV